MKILGLDLGTNSIGWVIRNTDLLENQFEKYGVFTFKKGVGSGKSGEFSYAAERTKHRSSRRLYQSRKYRIWATLEVLINNGYCPLTIDGLNRWRRYNKVKARNDEGGRAYPVNDKSFDAWIKLDFNEDRQPDYSSPYQLRKELAEKQFDFTKEEDRFKLGRALYHIAQRRGFKSSKGETIKEQEKEAEETGREMENENSEEIIISLKKSEQKKAGKLNEYIEKRKEGKVALRTIGCVFADLENKGERIREKWAQYAIRQQYEDEINFIFNFQNQLSTTSELLKKIQKAIFYKRPLRSQKGLVGKCTLEPTKTRCPISHPDFEEFRAWAFINNIRVKKQNTGNQEDWVDLPIELKNEIYTKLFIRTKANFKFQEIKDFIKKETNSHYLYNYKSKTNVSGCPISARLRNIFGDNWKKYSHVVEKYMANKSGKEHQVSYSIYDIWHVLFSFEDEEYVSDFARINLEVDEKKIKSFIIAWLAMPQGYSMLSLKAIRNINKFLTNGFIYTESVLLAKLPEILGKQLWNENENLFTEEISLLIEKNREGKRIFNITNNLISKYKSLEANKQFAFKNTKYILDESDLKDIEKVSVENFGKRTWDKLPNTEKQNIIKKTKELYQAFFKSSERNYYKLPKLGDTIKEFLLASFPEIPEKKVNLLYHPSQIDIYPRSKEQSFEFEGNLVSLRLLDSPKTGSFKNPMAMRTLHELRKLINYLLKTGQIDEETRIVVETARQLNDANMRWAIEAYQRQHEAENKEFEAAIIEMLKDSEFTGNANPSNTDDIEKVRLLSEQYDIKGKRELLIDTSKKRKKKDDKIPYYNSTEFLQKIIKEKDLLKKYRLWKEQTFRCIYTGKIIKITDLFAENVIDFEHTIPRSISFDNSLANLTVCFADFNRTVKRKQFPSQLVNHQQILDRLSGWEEKIERLKDNVEFWRKKSKGAATKEYKDKAIRQRHLWQMELNYWSNKLERFKMEEVTSGFKNSQLVDTQLISKYAYHYLKSVFNRVDVQKGSVTSDFRKIFGIQNVDEIKDRGSHSHHAKDAAVLTLIPAAAKRDEILKKAYEYAEDHDGRIQQTEVPYKGFKPDYILRINDDVLINNISRDQSLATGKKIVRKRGRIVYLKDKHGNLILDDQGNPEPKIATGDCIKGQLHAETFLGAIKQVKYKEDGKPLMVNGEYVFEKGLKFVKREKLMYKKDSQSPGFSNLKDLEKKIVNKDLFKIIKKQVDQVSSFKDALNEGIYMLDRKGKKINKIRHVRIYARDADPIKIKRHKYLSKSEHKQFYYTGNTENYAFGLYVDKNGNKKIKSLNLFQVSKIMKTISSNDINNYFEPKINMGRWKNKSEAELFHVFLQGQRVIFYSQNRNELFEMSKNEILKRLYYVRLLFSAEDGRIQFQHHLEARVDKELEAAFPKETFGQKGKYGFSNFNPEFVQPRLLLSPNNLNCLIEKKDFLIKPDGEIKLFDI